MIAKSEILSREKSLISMIPEGLLKTLSTDEVRDLIAYLRTTSQVPLPKSGGLFAQVDCDHASQRIEAGLPLVGRPSRLSRSLRAGPTPETVKSFSEGRSLLAGDHPGHRIACEQAPNLALGHREVQLGCDHSIHPPQPRSPKGAKI